MDDDAAVCMCAVAHADTERELRRVVDGAAASAHARTSPLDSLTDPAQPGAASHGEIWRRAGTHSPSCPTGRGMTSTRPQAARNGNLSQRLAHCLSYAQSRADRAELASSPQEIAECLMAQLYVARHFMIAHQDPYCIVWTRATDEDDPPIASATLTDDRSPFDGVAK